jgi:glycosyltransferase involved in cell wall biosynthesis
MLVRNSAADLPHVLPRIPRCVDEVVIVDRHSSDDTLAVISALTPEARIVMPRAGAPAEALGCGLRCATGDIIVRLAGNGSADPAEIPRFVARLLDGADFVKGSRLSAGARHVLSWRRRAGGWLLNAVVNGLAATRYRDVAYGFCAFWGDVLSAIDLPEAAEELDALINLRVATAGYAVHEIPSAELMPRVRGDRIRVGRVLRVAMRERMPGARAQAPARGLEYFELGGSALNAAVTLAERAPGLEPALR